MPQSDWLPLEIFDVALWHIEVAFPFQERAGGSQATLKGLLPRGAGSGRCAQPRGVQPQVSDEALLIGVKTSQPFALGMDPLPQALAVLGDVAAGQVHEGAAGLGVVAGGVVCTLPRHWPGRIPPRVESAQGRGTVGGEVVGAGALRGEPAADAAATTWQVSSTLLDGLANSATTVVSETVTVGLSKLARPNRIIASTSAVTAAACAADLSTKGCRALEFVYASATTATSSSFGDVSGQVKEIRLWSTVPGAATATSKAVQMYQYDDAGRLRRAWNAQISPSLITEYSYDSAGRVTQVTAPGELPWTFTYGQAGSSSTAGDGMLLKATRPGLKQGTTGTIEGEAATSIVYDVPLTGTTAPYKLGVADVKTWGQSDAPTDATAVFPADVVPASNTGSALRSCCLSDLEVGVFAGRAWV